MSKVLFSLAVLAGGVLIASAAPVLAASSADWASPAIEGAQELTKTLASIAGVIIGLAIAAFGLWSAMTGRVDWSKLWVYFISGVIVGAGPTGVLWFMDLVAQK